MFAHSEVKWDDPGFSQIWALYDSGSNLTLIWLRFDTQVTLFESWSGTLTQVQHVLFTISGLSLFDNFDTFWQLWSSKKRQKFVLLTTMCLSCRKSDWGESFCAATRVFRKCKGVQITPCYKKSILGSKQPVCGKCFFGRFLVRLSESDHSRVWSKASFFCARSN